MTEKPKDIDACNADAEHLTHARREFFARPLTDDYAIIWTELLSRQKEDTRKEGESVIVFRIADRWMAIPAGIVKIIIEPHHPHRIPHNFGLLRGIVNVEGELTLCVSLEELFRFESMEQPGTEENQRKAVERMIVINDGPYSWAFGVDEIANVMSVPEEKLTESPVTLAKSPTRLTRAIFEYSGRQVGMIDEKLLIDALRRSVS